MDEKYDGWAMKYIWNDYEGLMPNSFHERKSDVVKWWDGSERHPSWAWKNWRRRRGNDHKIVKVRLVEVGE